MQNYVLCFDMSLTMLIPVSNYAGGAGPLSEYERRIASGELADGDDFQVQSLISIKGALANWNFWML